jgi:hypothetical protein
MPPLLRSKATKDAKIIKKNCAQATESHAPNSETLKVFEDTDAGKNLTEHKNIDEMHESIKELE